MIFPVTGPVLKPECEALRTAVIGALLAERDIVFVKAGFADRLMEKLYANLTDSGWEITKAPPPKAREPGWYWVKLDHRLGWIVLNFSADGWTHLDGRSRDIPPPVIGPRIEEPK